MEWLMDHVVDPYLNRYINPTRYILINWYLDFCLSHSQWYNLYQEKCETKRDIQMKERNRNMQIFWLCQLCRQWQFPFRCQHCITQFLTDLNLTILNSVYIIILGSSTPLFSWIQYHPFILASLRSPSQLHCKIDRKLGFLGFYQYSEPVTSFWLVVSQVFRLVKLSVYILWCLLVEQILCNTTIPKYSVMKQTK